MVPDARDLVVGGLEWLLGTAVDSPEGLIWAAHPGDSEPDPTLYSGAAGIVVTLLEAHRHFGGRRYADAAIRGARSIAAAAREWPSYSLYFGLTGMAFALHAVAAQLGDGETGRAAQRARARVAAAFGGRRWGPQFDLLGGNAGSELAVTPYLHTAEITRAGVTWENRTGLAARRHHISHGTLGVAGALAATASAAGRADFMDLALAAVDGVIARNVAGGSGFLVPHSDPQQVHPGLERYSYGWCHGPAGDAQVFRLLGQLTGDPRWPALQDRCWRTVVSSGLPHRVRPGFWDSNGRCCGTAGVLALACDRAVEERDGLEFAAVLAADLRQRATIDAAGARWCNYEHRATPSTLAPRTGWAMGNAGIVRELLRLERVSAGSDPSYAVTWPDHPPIACVSIRETL
jgi:hypothetical protein